MKTVTLGEYTQVTFGSEGMDISQQVPLDSKRTISLDKAECIKLLAALQELLA